jgi:hypothetical protein
MPPKKAVGITEFKKVAAKLDSLQREHEATKQYCVRSIKTTSEALIELHQKACTERRRSDITENHVRVLRRQEKYFIAAIFICALTYIYVMFMVKKQVPT